MNRLDSLFKEKKEKILSVYFTAGYPELNNTEEILIELDKSGADIVEIGMPFSDPVADGPVIQQSSLIALNNGMSIRLLFQQLSSIREKTQIPIVLMGYFNPVFQFGIENFCSKCKDVGVDGVIIPDLPPELFIEEYKKTFDNYNIKNTLLVPPQSSDERIKQLDKWSGGFLYIVSSAATTGATSGFQNYQIEYFSRLQKLNLESPKLIGFGISNNSSFIEAGKYANGVIVGSAFIKAIGKGIDLKNNIHNFIKEIKG